jgi:hypothetical protein
VGCSDTLEFEFDFFDLRVEEGGFCYLGCEGRVF